MCYLYHGSQGCIGFVPRVHLPPEIHLTARVVHCVQANTPVRAMVEVTCTLIHVFCRLLEVHVINLAKVICHSDKPCQIWHTQIAAFIALSCALENTFGCLHATGRAIPTRVYVIWTPLWHLWTPTHQGTCTHVVIPQYNVHVHVPSLASTLLMRDGSWSAVTMKKSPFLDLLGFSFVSV